MKNPLDNRSLVVAGSALILALAGFVYVLRQPINPDLRLEFEERDFASTAGEELLLLIEELETLALDRSVVESAVFKSLEDNRVNIEEQPMGRENPFSGSNVRRIIEEE